MKVVFLDFDGVLNHVDPGDIATATSHEAAAGADMWDGSQIELEAVSRLNTLLERTGAHVVITSTWRKLYGLEELRTMLATRGFAYSERVVGVTPQLWRNEDGRRLWRGDEIQRWLDAHPDVERFVILDDDADMVHLATHHVQTKMATGLLDEDVEAAIEVLSVPQRW